jgi:hypothetical protein
MLNHEYHGFDPFHGAQYFHALALVSPVPPIDNNATCANNNYISKEEIL